MFFESKRFWGRCLDGQKADHADAGSRGLRYKSRLLGFGGIACPTFWVRETVQALRIIFLGRSYFFAGLLSAHRLRIISEMRLRAAADIVRFLRALLVVWLWVPVALFVPGGLPRRLAGVALPLTPSKA